MKRSLIALALGTFALGITEFGMMGILSDVADSLHVSIVQAGHLISTYSLGVAVGSPLLLFLRKMPLKTVMIVLSLVIFGGNLLAALSPNYTTLLCARFIAGLPHGAYFGAGAIVCSRIAEQGRGAQAVAFMVAGMTVANVIGVPSSTFLTHLFNWRVAFGGVALIGLITFLCLRSWLPYLPALPDQGLKGQFNFLRKPAPWLIYTGIFFGQASVYCWFSYVEPMMTQISGFSTASMTWIMMLAGLGMVTGNLSAGKLADRYRPSLVSACIAASLVVVMPLIYVLSPFKIPSLALTFLATGALFGIGGPLQYLIVRYSKGGEMLGGAGIQIAFNVSNAVSVSIGGLAIDHGFGLASPALVGVPFCIVGAVALFWLYGKYDREA
ncbi:MAG: MFS transporter [Bacteroides sp.]|nr:MFS transporter [Ruminococcus flavefaciens]MCM1554057.1 MFS transporter [Bacteroides sp.]